MHIDWRLRVPEWSGGEECNFDDDRFFGEWWWFRSRSFLRFLGQGFIYLWGFARTNDSVIKMDCMKVCLLQVAFWPIQYAATMRRCWTSPGRVNLSSPLYARSWNNSPENSLVKMAVIERSTFFGWKSRTSAGFVRKRNGWSRVSTKPELAWLLLVVAKVVDLITFNRKVPWSTKRSIKIEGFIEFLWNQ